MEVTFCELRAKEVVNIYDGRCLGNITDIVIDTSCARVLGIIVPKERKMFSLFKANSDFFIPYNRICKIGQDIILVELTTNQINSLSVNPAEQKNSSKPTFDNLNNFNYEEDLNKQPKTEKTYMENNRYNY